MFWCTYLANFSQGKLWGHNKLYVLKNQCDESHADLNPQFPICELKLTQCYQSNSSFLLFTVHLVVFSLVNKTGQIEWTCLFGSPAEHTTVAKVQTDQWLLIFSLPLTNPQGPHPPCYSIMKMRIYFLNIKVFNPYRYSATTLVWIPQKETNGNNSAVKPTEQSKMFLLQFIKTNRIPHKKSTLVRQCIKNLLSLHMLSQR